MKYLSLSFRFKKNCLLYNTGQKNVYLCKSECDNGVTPYRLGNQFVDKCPQGHNHIGYNNICKEECYVDPNGEYYYPINTLETSNSDEYIYKCISSCDDSITGNFKYYEKSNSYKCLDS